MENGQDSGLSMGESFAQFDPDTWSLRTCQHSLFGDLTEFSERLPKQGTMLNGKLYPQVTLEHHTSEIGSGSWPTPASRDWKDTPGMSETGPGGRNRVRPTGADGLLPRTVAHPNRSGQTHVGKGIQGGERNAGGNTPAGGGWWNIEPDVGRVDNGVPSRVDRLKCLGNAIVPQCVEAWVIPTIKHLERQRLSEAA